MKPLTQSQESLLCGREQEVRDLVANCAALRLTVLTAPPGLGTTSLLLAGVAPELARKGFVTVYFQHWDGHFFATAFKEAIAQAIREQADPNFFGEDEFADEMIERSLARNGRRVALLLDEFDDYLQCHKDTDIGDTFDAEISKVLSCRQVPTILVVKEESLLKLERLQPFVPNLLGYRFLLSPLSAAGARSMLQKRAHIDNMKIEEAAVDALLADRGLQVAGGYDPFFISVAADGLLERERQQRSSTITLKTVASAGGASSLVNEALDPVLNELGNSHKELFFRWCNILIADRRKRVAVAEKELEDYAGRLNRFVLTLLPRLEELKVLRTVQYPNTVRYEIARQSLVPIIQNWWDRREASIVARRRAVFRITSISLALGAIVVAYLLYLLVPAPQH